MATFNFGVSLFLMILSLVAFALGFISGGNTLYTVSIALTAFAILFAIYSFIIMYDKKSSEAKEKS